MLRWKAALCEREHVHDKAALPEATPVRSRRLVLERDGPIRVEAMRLAFHPRAHTNVVSVRIIFSLRLAYLIGASVLAAHTSAAGPAGTS